MRYGEQPLGRTTTGMIASSVLPTETARYLLSATPQSSAALLAIVVTGVLVLAQLGRYTIPPRIALRLTGVEILFYGLAASAMVLPLYGLTFEDYAVTRASFLLFVATVVALAPFVWHEARKQQPREAVRWLVRQRPKGAAAFRAAAGLAYQAAKKDDIPVLRQLSEALAALPHACDKGWTPERYAGTSVLDVEVANLVRAAQSPEAVAAILEGLCFAASPRILDDEVQELAEPLGLRIARRARAGLGGSLGIRARRAAGYRDNRLSSQATLATVVNCLTLYAVHGHGFPTRSRESLVKPLLRLALSLECVEAASKRLDIAPLDEEEVWHHFHLIEALHTFDEELVNGLLDDAIGFGIWADDVEAETSWAEIEAWASNSLVRSLVSFNQMLPRFNMWKGTKSGCRWPFMQYDEEDGCAWLEGSFAVDDYPHRMADSLISRHERIQNVPPNSEDAELGTTS